jgi:hypothetical protein
MINSVPNTINSAGGTSVDLGDMCREIWQFMKQNNPGSVNDPSTIRLLCGMLTGETNISNKELGELQKENGDRYVKYQLGDVRELK